MSIARYINPIYIAERMGGYYIPFVIGAWTAFFFLGASCGR